MATKGLLPGGRPAKVAVAGRHRRLVVAGPGVIPGGRPVVGVAAMRPAVVGTMPGGYGAFGYGRPGVGVMGPGVVHAVNPQPAFGGGLFGRPHVHPVGMVGRPVVVG